MCGAPVRTAPSLCKTSAFSRCFQTTRIVPSCPFSTISRIMRRISTTFVTMNGVSLHRRIIWLISAYVQSNQPSCICWFNYSACSSIVLLHDDRASAAIDDFLKLLHVLCRSVLALTFSTTNSMPVVVPQKFGLFNLLIYYTGTNPANPIRPTNNSAFPTNPNGSVFVICDKSVYSLYSACTGVM